MVLVIPFEAERFRSTARHYKARPAYAPRLIENVMRFCGLTAASAVMDLGCGPGPLAVAFAPLVGRMLAVDPEPEMLNQAAENATAAGVTVEFRTGSSYDLSPVFGRFDAVTIGRAFHWMDRADTLRRLDGLIEPGGAVVLFRDSHPDLPDNGWLAAYREVTERYATPGAWRGPDWVRHEAVLLDSPFSLLDELTVIERRTIPADSLIDRALSRSVSSPARLGDAAEALAAEIRGLLPRVAPDGTVTEVVASSALVARRP